MHPRQLFSQWAPPESPWSAWAKPSLFATMGSPPDDATASLPHPAPLPVPAAKSSGDTAFVVDLPGALSVTAGLELARAGFRPVPLYNTTHGSRPAVPVDSLASALAAGAADLASLTLRDDAPPAFLLDSSRQRPLQPAPGTYDNRWLVLPQDFPSAAMLRSRGITRVRLWLETAPHIAEDLAHVCYRWQEAGIALLDATAAPREPSVLHVPRPTAFRSLLRQFLVTLGLRRSSAGGFGGRVPTPSSSHG